MRSSHAVRCVRVGAGAWCLECLEKHDRFNSVEGKRKLCTQKWNAFRASEATASAMHHRPRKRRRITFIFRKQLLVHNSSAARAMQIKWIIFMRKIFSTRRHSARVCVWLCVLLAGAQSFRISTDFSFSYFCLRRRCSRHFKKMSILRRNSIRTSYPSEHVLSCWLESIGMESISIAVASMHPTECNRAH